MRNGYGHKMRNGYGVKCGTDMGIKCGTDMGIKCGTDMGIKCGTDMWIKCVILMSFFASFLRFCFLFVFFCNGCNVVLTSVTETIVKCAIWVLKG